MNSIGLGVNHPHSCFFGKKNKNFALASHQRFGMKLMEEKETDDDADADDDERGNFKSLCFPEVRALRRAFTRGKLSASSTTHVHDEIVSL